MNRLADNMRWIREYSGYTQKFVADFLGLERSTYGYYENGKTQPSIQNLYKLSKLYGLTMDDFLTFDFNECNHNQKFKITPIGQKILLINR